MSLFYDKVVEKEALAHFYAGVFFLAVLLYVLHVSEACFPDPYFQSLTSLCFLLFNDRNGLFNIHSEERSFIFSKAIFPFYFDFSVWHFFTCPKKVIKKRAAAMIAPRMQCCQLTPP
ncbi:MAG TPA: hypothetical protein VEV15_10825 [Flavisolibacter sp.]|nr:hypothetical protein [Flavisolibacter sp.]